MGRDFACICLIRDTEYNGYYRKNANTIQDFRAFHFSYRWEWCIQPQTIESGKSIIMRSVITKVNDWSCLLTTSLVEAERVLIFHLQGHLIYNVIDWYVYMIYFIVLLFFQTFLQTFKTLDEICHIWKFFFFRFMN